MKYSVTFGLTVQAYGHAEIEADNEQELAEKLEELLEDNGGEELVHCDWDSADDYRIVTVRDEADQWVDHETLKTIAE